MNRRMHGGSTIAQVTLAAICGCAALSAQTTPQPSGPQKSVTASDQQPVVLDHVVAIVNGEVLLESDVREEMRLAALQPISVPAGQNTVLRAMQRLINRSLILRQMREQKQVDYAVPDDAVQQSLNELKTQLPLCRQMHCTTEEGWQKFLTVSGLAEDEVFTRWRQRLEMLKFIQARFGSGIRIPRQDIENYYKTNVVTTFEKMKETPPTMESVSDRIREILLQQQVNSFLRDWLHSLREQGSVQILDPTYGEGIAGAEDDDSEGGA